MPGFLEDIVRRQTEFAAACNVKPKKKKTEGSSNKDKKIVVGVRVPLHIYQAMKGIIEEQGEDLGVRSLRELALLCIKEQIEKLERNSKAA